MNYTKPMLKKEKKKDDQNAFFPVILNIVLVLSNKNQIDKLPKKR
jgi:hypothetical protein